MGLDTGPWAQQAFNTAAGGPTGGPFTASGGKGTAGDATAQAAGAARQVGEMGGYPIGQVDVRTPLMRGLEQASTPLLIQALTNPQGIMGQLQGMQPSMPSATQPSTLASMIFGGAGPTQQGGQPTGQPPAGTPPPPPNAIQPPVDPRTGQTQQPGGPGVATGELGLPLDRQPGDGQPDPFTQTNSLQQQILHFAERMSPTFSQINWQNPLMGTNAPMDSFFQSLLPILSTIPDRGFVNGQPSVGSGATALSQLLMRGNPALAGLPVGAMGAADMAQQIAALMPPEALAHVVRNMASIGGGGQAPTLMDFLARIGFTQGNPANMVGTPGVQGQFSGGIQTRAQGGPLDPNAFTLVGEAGPELIGPAGGAPGGMQQVMPLGGAPNLGANGQMTGSMQASGAGMLGNQLLNNPELDAFNQVRTQLSGPGGALGGGGTGIVDALKPVWQQNLRFGLNELTNSVPSVANSAAAVQGADLTSRALNDFNLFAAQAMQQGQQTQLGAGSLLGQLAGQAGNGQFGRTLAAGQAATQRDLGMGQLGLQQQQQQWNQTVNPTLQLLLAALGAATPTAYQTIVPGKK